MAVSWYVAQTEPFKGMVAEREIVGRLGLVVFNPKIRTVYRSLKKRDRETIRPYVPGYLFVQFDVCVEGWERINKQRGVRSLMYAASEVPARVKDEALLPLMAMCLDGFLIEEEADSFLFKVGSTARAMEGPFAGFSGKVERSSLERVTVMIDIFGRPVPVDGRPAMFELVRA